MWNCRGAELFFPCAVLTEPESIPSVGKGRRSTHLAALHLLSFL